MSEIQDRTYWNIEKGRSLPSLEVARRIAKALKTTVDALFPVSDVPHADSVDQNSRERK
jgi:DNA-binding XRE family transcriptional regulator